jgi:hypothetical protein
LVVGQSQQRQRPSAETQRRGQQRTPAQPDVGAQRLGVAPDVERAPGAVAKEVQVDAALDRRAAHIAVVRRDDMDTVAAACQPGGDLFDERGGGFARILWIRRSQHANLQGPSSARLS